MYHVRMFNARPLCEHMACQAGLTFAREAGVTQCDYRTLRDARRAVRQLNAVPGYAGCAQVVQGACTVGAYVVTLTFQFPAWDERAGIRYDVDAMSKSDAIRQARRLAERDGHCPQTGKGRITFAAVGQ